MLRNLKRHSKIIIVLVAVAMVATGAFYFAGVGGFSSSSNNIQAQQYIASINGTRINHEEFNYLLQVNSQHISSQSQLLPFKLEILNALIDQELLSQQAEEMNLKPDIPEEDVDNYLQQIMDDNGIESIEEFEELLNEGFTVDDYRNDLRQVLENENLMLQARESSYSDIVISDEEVDRAFERVNIQMISKEYQDNIDDSEEENEEWSRDVVKSEMDEALAEIEQGSDFAEVAANVSDLNLDNAETGFIARDAGYFSGLTEEEKEIVFAMEQGEVSDLIDTGERFLVVKFVGKEEVEEEEMIKEKESIRQNLLTSRQQQAYQEWMSDIKENSEIEIYDPQLRGFKELQEGNYTEAIKAFNTALEYYSDIWTYQYLANAYQQEGQHAMAVQTLDDALEIYDSNWELHVEYANMLSAMEDYDHEGIVSHLETASELAAGEPMLYLQKYIIYSRIGDQERAQDAMEMYQDIYEQQQQQMMQPQQPVELEDQEVDIQQEEITE